MFVINVKGNIISVQETEPITSGSVNVYQCRFAFDNSWEGFFRSAVFRVGPMVRTVPLNDEDSCELPWELLVKKNIGLPVEVSVYGAKDETEILPTIWDKMGRVRSGSEPGEDVKDPTPTVYNQLTNIVRVYSEKVTEESEAAAKYAAAANLSAQDAHASAQTATAAVSGINASVAAAAVSAAAAKESENSAVKSASTAQASETTVLTAASEATSAARAASESKAVAEAAAENAATAAESLSTAASTAVDAARTAVSSAATATESAAEAVTSAENAARSAASATASAESASASAAEAEEWSKKAEQAAGGGVLTFNGRSGEVIPLGGDYTAEMVGADASGSAEAALAAATAYTDTQIAAIPAPDVSGQISVHNSSTAAHSDIRSAIPTKVSQLTNDKGYITGYTETDPTVPSWAKAASKPSYTASEVGAAASSHNHGAGNITSGTLAVARGGTGVTANPSMLVNLGSTTAASVFAASPRPGVTGTLPVARGGTGATTAAAARTNLGAAPAIKYGTSDVTAGSASSYADGTLYVVIE